MNREIRNGRWLQITGRTKRAWGRFFGNDELAARGDAEIVAGALEESLGIAKKRAVNTVTRGVDRFAETTKRLARSL
jgi:uncharacterized protein YjbJ (UPF0337 family)